MVAVVASAAVVVALAALAASIGPSDVLRGDGPDRMTVSEPVTTATESIEPAQPPESDEEDDPADRTWLRVVVNVLFVGAALLALYALAQLLRLLSRPRLPRGSGREEAVDEDVDVLPSPHLVAEAIAADAELQYQALLTGTPRQAITECWQRFEDRVAVAGVRRHRWETSSELTQRVLTTIGADPAAVHELAELFRLARFSRQEVGEDLRDHAVDLLREIQTGLRRSGASP